jgi:hypothetical protein
VIRDDLAKKTRKKNYFPSLIQAAIIQLNHLQKKMLQLSEAIYPNHATLTQPSVSILFNTVRTYANKRQRKLTLESGFMKMSVQYTGAQYTGAQYRSPSSEECLTYFRSHRQYKYCSLFRFTTAHGVQRNNGQKSKLSLHVTHMLSPIIKVLR